ncbi:MAG: CotH kinase family protein, partial [Planctomycetes bacterium]|nr:CotH kinase family protein [Planctomycetota bacterium]
MAFEPLEARQMLAAQPIISEFLAKNDDGLTDAAGRSSDWIEIHNAGDQEIDLAGWHLTDDALLLDKWEFSSVVLRPGAYLVVFASGDGVMDVDGNLHANFQLDADGEYLALVRPDGSVADEFAPNFPEQFEDVSYGVEQALSTTTLVEAGSPARMLVPTAADEALIGSTWTGGDEPLNDDAWQDVTVGVGFDDAPPPPPLSNVALNKPARQSTNGFGLPAGNAVDGNRGGNSISHTATGDVRPWWEVDLGDDFFIESINVFTRDNCCSPERDYNLTVEVRDAADEVLFASDVFNPWDGGGGQATSVGFGASFTVDLSQAPGGGVTGRKVRVSKVAFGGTNSEWLHLAEVEVMARDFPPGAYSRFISTDVEDELKGQNASALLRVPFEVSEAALLANATLSMQYDDGFVAYINGVEVGRGSAPGGTVSFTAQATAEHDGTLVSDFNVPAALLHNGENILAIHALNRTAGDADFLILPKLVARKSPSATAGYFLEPTPGEANGLTIAGFVGDTRFDVDRGFYDAPFDVNITTDTPGATIVYTTDGSAPTLDHGTRVDSPNADSPPVATLRVETTTTLRAAAFKEDFEPTNVDTQTYIFLEDVIRQPASLPGFPTTWDGVAQSPISADYQMDPDVVNDPAYRDEIIQGLRDIPTMSIVMDPADLFGQERGIYINSNQRGRAWERATSVEIIEPDGTSFQADSGIRIHGFSWRRHSLTPKHSFRLEFRDEYGPKKLEYPLFPDAPVDKFDSIVLRAQGGRSWGQATQLPAQAQYLRDTFARDLAREMDAVDGHATLVHLYLNGLYWGLYNPVERPDAQMGEEYFGGSDEDYDALNRRTSTNEVIDGDLVRYNEMIALANRALAARVTTDADYAELQRMVAMDDFIDWIIRNQYVTNRDGLTAFDGNNQRAIGSRVGDPQFRFFVWDMEYSMWNATDNNNIAPGLNSPALAGSQNPQAHAWNVYTALRQNEEFRLRYADHVHRHLFNNGALTPAAAAETWEVRARSIERAIIGESARWGDARRATPYTRDREWQTERNRLLRQYFPRRTDILLGQYRAVGLYPSVDAPSYNQHGGEVADGFELTMTNENGPGIIYYTTDGSDPRLEGGAIRLGALVYDGTITIDNST